MLRVNIVIQLIYMTVELIVGIAMGFIPYVDNFGELLPQDFEISC